MLRLIALETAALASDDTCILPTCVRRHGTAELCPAAATPAPWRRILWTESSLSLIRFAVLVFLLALPGAGGSAALPDDDYANLARAVIDQVVVPSYEAYARATRTLGPAIERHCIGHAGSDTAAIRAAFGEAMDAWQRAWPFSFGPVEQGAGRARFQFWPGRPGSAARQIRKVLRARDEALHDPGLLAGKSFAIKDLQALERLLFDVPRDTFTCGLAHAIARYQSDLSAEVLDAWTRDDGFRHAALSAGGDSDVYEEDSEVARDLMRALSEGLEAVAARKLMAPLGKRPESAKPRRAENWRSGRSLRNVILNLETLRAMVETHGGFADLVTAHGQEALAGDLRDGFAAAAAKASSVDPELRDAVTDPDEREKLRDLLESLRALRALVTGPLSQATGILIGFNSQDGD